MSKRLTVSVRSVSHEVERLRQRTCTRNRIELAAWCGCNGLYRPSYASGLTARAPTHPPLTPRQAQIVNCIAAGMVDKEIADLLGLSGRTIRTHLERLFSRYAVHTRAAVVAISRRPPGVNHVVAEVSVK